MQRARMLGNYIQELAEKKDVSISDLSALLDCEEHQVKSLLKGRSFATFQQLSALAERFGVSVTDLLDGDEVYYNRTVVHCMNHFQNPQNRETILDIIDDYMDILDAVD